jgi:site-specific recombinase XerD
MAREPTLQTHATGVHFTHWNGRRRYFTKDRRESERLFLESKALYHLWKATGVDHDQPPTEASPDPHAPAGAELPGPLPPGPPRTIAALAKLFLENTEATVEGPTAAYYRKHLSRFLNLWGRAPLLRYDRQSRGMQLSVGAAELEALKVDMRRPTRERPAGYDPATVNHDIVAVKRLFNWAEALEYIPRNRCRGVSRLAVEPPLPKAIPAPIIRACMIGVCLQGLGARCDLADKHLHMAGAPCLPPEPADPNLACWLELSYYALLRPSETVKLVQRRGSLEDEFEGGGVFRLEKGKTSKKSRMPRRVILSPRAMLAWRSARPTWSTLDGYSAAVRRLCGPGGPHALRHSGATHLGVLGVDRATIDWILGHYPPRVSLIYNPGTWRPLIATAAKLDLAAPGGPAGAATSRSS